MMNRTTAGVLFIVAMLILAVGPSSKPAGGGVLLPGPFALPGEDIQDARSAQADEPLRMVGPIGGIASGQVVVGGGSPVRGLRAEVSAIRGEDGGTIPSDAVEIRYVVGGANDDDNDDGDYVLRSRPPQEGAAAVWLIVEIPTHARPGQYTGQIDIRTGRGRRSVPVELEVAGWRLPEGDDREVMLGLMQSPDTIAAHYDVRPFSQEHFRLMEPSLRYMAAAGGNLLYIPVIRNEHMGNDDGLIHWRRGRQGWEVDFSAFERYLDIYAEHGGEPKALALIVWRPGRDDVEVNERVGQGRLEPLEASYDADFWKPLMDGVRQRVRSRGWDDSIILLGTGWDSRPSEEVVGMFKDIAPYARWLIFSHMRGDPSPRDGRHVIENDIEIGVLEVPYPPNRGRGANMNLPDPDNEYVHLTTHRGRVTINAEPFAFRIAGEETFGGGRGRRHSGFSRIGLDFWSVDGRRVIGRHDRQHNLYRFNPRAILKPGEDGARPTVQALMLREGVQEAEAYALLGRALQGDSSVSDDVKDEIREVLDRRGEMRDNDDDSMPAREDPDAYLQVSLEMYNLAGQVRPPRIDQSPAAEPSQPDEQRQQDPPDADTPTQRPQQDDPQDQSRSLYVLAQNYIDAGMDELARRNLQRILDEYPDSEWAEKARELMEQIED